jgi:hypothetical protein
MTKVWRAKIRRSKVVPGPPGCFSRAATLSPERQRPQYREGDNLVKYISIRGVVQPFTTLLIVIAVSKKMELWHIRLHSAPNEPLGKTLPKGSTRPRDLKLSDSEKFVQPYFSKIMKFF